MSFLLAAFVVVTFAVTIERLKLVDRAREAGRRASEAHEVLRDPSLDDDAKERRLQRHAIRLFQLVGILTAGSLVALLLPLGVVWTLDALGVASLDEVLSVLERIDFLAGTLVVGLLGYLFLRHTGRL